MTSGTLALVADVVAPYPGGLELPRRTELAVKVLVEGEALPSRVLDAFERFVEQPSEDSLRSAQEAVARSGLFGIGSEQFVHLAARLLTDGRLTGADAASLLAALPHRQRKGLAQAAAHLVEVADAVAEDARDGIMEVDDDQLLRDAAASLLNGD